MARLLDETLHRQEDHLPKACRPIGRHALIKATAVNQDHLDGSALASGLEHQDHPAALRTLFISRRRYQRQANAMLHDN